MTVNIVGTDIRSIQIVMNFHKHNHNFTTIKQYQHLENICKIMVRAERIELSLPKKQDFESCVSTNSTTPA